MQIPDYDDAIAITIEQSIVAIREWWSHLLRIVNQDQARIDIISNMQNNVSL